MTITAIIIGCFTGFLSAFFGIGGSSIDTPLLRIFLHLPPYIALGTPLPASIVTIIVALLVYWKKHLVDMRVFAYSVLGGLPGIIAGSYASRFFSGKVLMILTAVAIFAIGWNFALNGIAEKNTTQSLKKQNEASSIYITAIAFLCSVISGVLANGGGIFLVAVFVKLLRMEMKKAVATSLLTIAVLVIPACIIHYQLEHIDLTVSLAMSGGVIPMAYLGAKMDLRTKSSTIKMLFGILLVVFSLYFFVSQLQI
ncbi:MAG: sulfite exporter TauE/SafE family protein [Parcubacteria group bacterium]|jgi:hypothetical protein